MHFQNKEMHFHIPQQILVLFPIKLLENGPQEVIYVGKY